MKIINFIRFLFNWNICEYGNPFFYIKNCPIWLKKPKFKWYIGKYIPKYGDYANSIIGFWYDGLGWKDKYDSPRFEWNPYILLKIFKWCIRLDIVSPNNINNDEDIYWETLLDAIEYNKDFKTCIKENTWFSDNGIYNVKTLKLLKK